MNILYCGDINIIDGLIISIISLLKHTKKSLHIYVLTMKYENEVKKYTSMPKDYIERLDKYVKEYNKDNFVTLIDITNIVNECLPEANINTKFTPFCMLRLYADQIKELPSKILYLDNDVVCLKNPKELYEIDNSNYEVVGVLDYYGKRIYKKNIFKEDYINSGVLLLNLDLIKETGLFEKTRKKCKKVKMLLPDQSAINMYLKHKLIVDDKFNNQHEITPKTVFRHFTTTFRLFPTFKTQTIKPWHIDKLHEVLKCYEIDDVLEEYKEVLRRVKDE